MGRRVRKSRAGLKSWKQLVACVKLMNFAFSNVRIYPPTHSEVKDVVARLHKEFAGVFDELQDVGFGYMDEVLYIEGAMSIEETANNEVLVDIFKKCRLKYVTIEKTASLEDLLNFFVLANDEAKKPSLWPTSCRTRPISSIPWLSSPPSMSFAGSCQPRDSGPRRRWR